MSAVRIWVVALIAIAPLVIGCAHKKATTRDDDDAWARDGWPSDKDAATTAGLDCRTVKVAFEYDSSELTEEARRELQQKVGCVKASPKMFVTIEGNTDERGTEEYNMALGDRRALTVSKYMQSLGAPGVQLRAVSYGEELPECMSSDEACWARNRRASVKLRGGAGKKAD